jgi:hypothetical protein
MLAAAGVAFVAVGCGGGGSNTTLAAAHEACGGVVDGEADTEAAESEEEPAFEFTGQLRDEGRTIIIDGRGKDHPEEQQLNAMLSYLCILEELDAPESLHARMNSTRAMDGTQSYDQGPLNYVWSYHPDSGMNLIIEESDE